MGCLLAGGAGDDGLLDALAFAVFFHGRLDSYGRVLLPKALAALVDHDIASGVLEAVDVGGTEGTLKVLDPLDGQGEELALAHGADVLAAGVLGGKLGLALRSEPLLIGKRLADDFGLLVGQAAAFVQISRKLAEKVNEAAVAPNGERVGAVVAVVIVGASKLTL